MTNDRVEMQTGGSQFMIRWFSKSYGPLTNLILGCLNKCQHSFKVGLEEICI